MKPRQIASALLLSVCAGLASPARAEVVRDERVKMTSPMSITIDAPAGREAEAKSAIGAGYAETDRLAALLSEWSPESDVSRVNAAAGNGMPVHVARETYEVITAAVEIGRLTEGAFDITFLPIGRCWKFKQTPPALPDAAALERAKTLVDYRRIQLDSKALTVALPDSGMGIGLGGIAQGYIADRVADVIRARGFTNFMVDVSGDLRVDGMIEGRPWRVGIKHPRLTGRTVATVPIANGLSISTAGDYEKFFELGGRRYHHIIDPKTGYPAPGCQSVTVVSLDTMLTDGLDTGLFVMGPERAIALAEKLPDVEAMIVDANGNVHTTSGFRLDKPEAGPAPLTN
jgi:FAD:protein FMN transferase